MSLRSDYPKRIGPALVGIAASVLYTAPQRIILTEALLSNSTGQPVTVSLYIVPANGTPQTSNAFLNSVQVQPNGIYPLTSQYWPIEQGETLQAIASVAASIVATLVLSDREDGIR